MRSSKKRKGVFVVAKRARERESERKCARSQVSLEKGRYSYEIRGRGFLYI